MLGVALHHREKRRRRLILPPSERVIVGAWGDGTHPRSIAAAGPASPSRLPSNLIDKHAAKSFWEASDRPSNLLQCISTCTMVLGVGCIVAVVAVGASATSSVVAPVVVMGALLIVVGLVGVVGACQYCCDLLPKPGKRWMTCLTLMVCNAPNMACACSHTHNPPRCTTVLSCSLLWLLHHALHVGGRTELPNPAAQLL